MDNNDSIAAVPLDYDPPKAVPVRSIFRLIVWLVLLAQCFSLIALTFAGVFNLKSFLHGQEFLNQIRPWAIQIDWAIDISLQIFAIVWAVMWLRRHSMAIGLANIWAWISIAHLLIGLVVYVRLVSHYPRITGQGLLFFVAEHCAQVIESAIFPTLIICFRAKAAIRSQIDWK